MICFVYLLMKPQPYQYYVMYKDYNLLQIPSYCVTSFVQIYTATRFALKLTSLIGHLVVLKPIFNNSCKLLLKIIIVTI